ncbi:PREDICTED: cytochrome P450 2B6-like [Propithecus coquereli]|uniref:cytochrome P450 2B6-like n=1 Tax=Propithecus coquereli TaxID=379532 RepID=UPI00063FBD22|nr:PREDICTED: cytochrome P450 2B6-like [Propithecus coquereli]
MELSVLLFFAVLMGLLLLLVKGRPSTRGYLPPGPHPLPFLGNLLQMDRGGLLKSFLRLREKYGDVFTVYLGQRPAVMLCGIEAIKEALVDQAEDFSGRGKIATVEPVLQGYGVVFANGDRWKALRRFSVATMRDFGMGKRSVEERIQEEAQCLVEELRKSKGALLNPIFLFHCITSNIICSIVFGKRFDYKDEEFLRLQDLFYQSFSLVSSLYGQVREMERDREGKRICVGEGIAKAELFLFFTTILQNFSLASPVAPEDIDLTPQKSGVGKIPPRYQIRFLPR